MANPTTTPAVKTGDWAEQKTKLRAKFPNLMESDFHFKEGKKEEMMVRLQKKLGKSKSGFSDIMKSL